MYYQFALKKLLDSLDQRMVNSLFGAETQVASLALEKVTKSHHPDSSLSYRWMFWCIYFGTINGFWLVLSSVASLGPMKKYNKISARGSEIHIALRYCLSTELTVHVFMLFCMEHNHASIISLIILFAVKLYINISFSFWDAFVFSWFELGAGKVVLTPTKVDCLTDFRVKMVALGSEHSIAVTGD